MGNASDDGAKGGSAGRPAGRSSLAERAPGRVMASLLVTPDDELEGFRRACLGEDSRVEVAKLVMARHVLKAVGRALAEDKADQWQRLTAAWEALAPPGAAPPAKKSEPNARMAAELPRTPQGAMPDRPEMLALVPPPARPSGPGIPAPTPSAPSTHAGAPRAEALPPGVARWTDALAASAASRGRAPATLVDEGPGLASPSAALPFAQGDGRARIPPPAASTPRGVLAMSGSSEETLPVTSLSAAERAQLDALPFRSGGASVEAKAGPRPPAPGSGAAPSAPQASTLLVEQPEPDECTLAIDPSAKAPVALGGGQALPFRLRAGGSPAEATPAGQRPAEPPAGEAATRRFMMRRPAAGVAAGAPPPAAQPSQPTAEPPEQVPGLTGRLAAMSVGQYAALCAECAASPEHAEQIQLRYGVSSPSERATLDLHWRRRMAADAALHAQWAELCGRVMAGLRPGSPR